MIFKVHSQFTQTLLSLPESGMGYQIIDAKRQGSYSTERFIAYNGELIVNYENDFASNKRKIVSENYTKMFSQLDFIELEKPTLVRREELSNVSMFSENTMYTKDRQSGGISAVESAPIYESATDIFVRLSAFYDDKRIDFVNKKLKDGAYTTTEADYLSCKGHNDDPVDRYALPNDDKIKWAFFVKPKIYDVYKLDIVQPANNRNGGGIEKIF